MVGLLVNVDRVVVGFHIGLEFFRFEVKFDVEEVGRGDVDLVGKLQTHRFKKLRYSLLQVLGPFVSELDHCETVVSVDSYL